MRIATDVSQVIMHNGINVRLLKLFPDRRISLLRVRGIRQFEADYTHFRVS